MFIIFGMGSKKSKPIEIFDINNKRYYLFFIYAYFSLFFIPIFKWNKQFFIATEGVEREILKEEFITMKQSGAVDSKFVINPQQHHANTYKDTSEKNQECANEFCPVCKNKLDKKHLYCPFCGQKQPVKNPD